VLSRYRYGGFGGRALPQKLGGTGGASISSSAASGSAARTVRSHGMVATAATATDHVLRYLAGLDAERARLDIRTMALEGHESIAVDLPGHGARSAERFTRAPRRM